MASMADGHLGPQGVRICKVPLLKQAWKLKRLEPIMKLEAGFFKRRTFFFLERCYGLS